MARQKGYAVIVVVRYWAGGRNMAFENPPIPDRKIVTVKDILFHQLSGNGESVASKGQVLGSISTRLGIKHEHRVWATPFPHRFVEAWCLILHIRIDANGNN